MRSRDGIKVAMSTSGSVTPGYADQRQPYRWRGVPGWTPGDVRFREENRPGPGGAANASRRHARLERFGVVLAELTAGEPERASDAHVREAGKAVGVGEKTAREYRKALLQRGAP
jgi:hypothetical protein